MRTLVGVLIVLLVLAPLAAWAVRGLRRIAWTGQVEDVPRTTLQTITEGLIVLGAVIVGALIVVAVLD
ncbi:MAG TPA: hypothetical protein VHR46_08270 [Gaiella sp.]|nr:hypothetical protein [Gaiella sp.]